MKIITFKTAFCLILFLTISFLLFGASSRLTLGNIPYRTYADNDTNSYMKTRCKLDISYIKDSKSMPTIIFIHGGGLTSGAKFFPNGGIENRNIIQVAPNYRFSPNVRCPAYIEDAAAAIAWVFKNISNYGGDPNKIYLSGVSAGAYLASMVYFDKSYLIKYGIDSDSLAGLFAYSGQMTTHYQVCQEMFGGSFPTDSKYIDIYAPLYHLRKTIKPIYFYTGDRALDMPGRYDQNLQMKKELTKLGNNQVYYVELNGFNHNTFLTNALKGTCRVLDGEIFYNDSINNSLIITNIIDINFPEKPIVKLINGIMYIELNEMMNNIKIYNIQGHVVYNVNTNSNDVIFNASSLFKIKGVYFIEILTKQNKYLKKLIVC